MLLIDTLLQSSASSSLAFNASLPNAQNTSLVSLSVEPPTVWRHLALLAAHWSTSVTWALTSCSHLFVKLHQALLTGVGVLFVIKVLVVVHVPAHLLLVIHGTLRGQTDQYLWSTGPNITCYLLLLYSTHLSEDGVDVLPQRMVILDGFTDFSHLLQQTRLHSKTLKSFWHVTETSWHSPPSRPPGSPLHPPSPSSAWTPWSRSWWVSVRVVRRSSRTEGFPPDRSRAAAPAGTDPRCSRLWSRWSAARTCSTRRPGDNFTFTHYIYVNFCQ